MAEDGFAPAQSDAPPKELELRFWWLVLLAKLGILVLGAGLVTVAVTEYRLAGLALTLIGVGIGLRWAYLLRKSQRAIESGNLGADRA